MLGMLAYAVGVAADPLLLLPGLAIGIWVAPLWRALAYGAVLGAGYAALSAGMAAGRLAPVDAGAMVLAALLVVLVGAGGRRLWRLARG